MTALTADLSLTGEIVRVDAPLSVGQFYFLEDEVVLVRGSVTLTYTDVTNGDGWYIDRGQDHSTPATHASGTTFTLAREFATGAGGGAIPDPATGNVGDVVLVNEGQDGYELATTVPDPAQEADGFIPISESGAWVLRPKGIFAQDTDPGAVGPFSVWIATGDPALLQFWRRNVTDDGWLGIVTLLTTTSLGLSSSDVSIEATVGDMTLASASGIVLSILSELPTVKMQITTGGAIQFMDDEDNGLVAFEPLDGIIKFFQLPSVDPENEGQLYTDGVVSAGTPQALMVSGGPA